MIRMEEDTLVVVEVRFHNHSVQRRGYRGGRAGLGCHGEPFPMELQVLNPCVSWISKLGALVHTAMLVGTVVLHARVNLARLPMAMLHGRGNLSDPMLGKHFCSIFTRSYRMAVLPPVVCARPTARLCAWPCGSGNLVFSGSISELNVED
ncbi:hypothetical protein GOBAR_AA25083 [Gossypium barbadense]|uniref:Uncharacterized protein n=1 Tax=Gossypium barbadense TaxID=3634 RepID=A0A2P5WWW6_GOSBA|nr:hypothetical protein GOBAR_AA25083 [Gossypium barbadense]